MTEDGAKRMWCPFSRLSSYTGEAAVNRRREDGGILPSSGCIASECMAWRWALPHYQIVNGKAGPIDDGYCGLAGNPHP